MFFIPYEIFGIVLLINVFISVRSWFKHTEGAMKTVSPTQLRADIYRFLMKF